MSNWLYSDVRECQDPFPEGISELKMMVDKQT